MTLMAAYDAAVARGDIHDDGLQRQVLCELQRVAQALARPARSFWGVKKPVMGLYLHGPVGVGKTYLVDLFYQSLTIQNKKRFHFHQFMQEVDAQLRRLQGQKNPVRRIAADLAKTTRLLCLDEFLVHDVADAMILAALLRALFEHGIVLVAAANTAPDDLYWNGVQRERFLPAIALITAHCQVVALTQDHDYRRGRMPLAHAYLTPLNKASENALTEQFEALGQPSKPAVDLMVQQRLIRCVQCNARAVWFTFDVLCNVPRCQLDYLELASRYDTVFVSGIPALSREDTGRALLFIHLIDVMYDNGIRLVVSAAVPAADLYLEGPLLTSFQRTVSRLDEMQSMDYLQRHAHRNLSHF
ncbi:MAG TPA: cell division protein ZapE [Legionella sp.]|nr:cell division protein ZapE [Legionella sp.]